MRNSTAARFGPDRTEVGLQQRLVRSGGARARCPGQPDRRWPGAPGPLRLRLRPARRSRRRAVGSGPRARVPSRRTPQELVGGSSLERARRDRASATQWPTMLPVDLRVELDPGVGPGTKAWSDASVRATDSAPGGALNRSSCQTTHGPGGIRSGSSVSTSRQPISGCGPGSPRRPGPGPAADRRSRRPRTGMPSATASATSRRSSSIHPTDGSVTDSTDPITTRRSNGPGRGSPAGPAVGAEGPGGEPELPRRGLRGCRGRPSRNVG